MLARLLQKNQIPCSIYESEASRDVRNQGGTLDLHPKAGQLALKEAGLLGEFKKHARPEGECSKILKYDGTVLWDENEMGTSHRGEEVSNRPEIDRSRLRDLLMDSVEPGTIKFNKALLRADADARSIGLPRSREKYNLHFTDGSVEEDIDLVVGADGAWSQSAISGDGREALLPGHHHRRTLGLECGREVPVAIQVCRQWKLFHV